MRFQSFISIQFFLGKLEIRVLGFGGFIGFEDCFHLPLLLGHLHPRLLDLEVVIDDLLRIWCAWG